jgi:3-(3-hydroxy-phenyl)propionate hydroxylase
VKSRIDTDVAIVGAGPVGLCLANMLGEQGARVVVLERNEGIFDAPRAAHFDGEIMRIFESIGLADRVSDVSVPVGEMRFEDEHGDALFTVGLDGLRRHGWPDASLFHQPDLEAVLLHGTGRYDQVAVLFGREVSELESTPAGSLLRTSDGLEITARFVVGCDGAGSVIRRRLPMGSCWSTATLARRRRSAET